MRSIFEKIRVGLRINRVLCGFVVVSFFLFSIASNTRADCSCSTGANGIYVMGFEFIATTCPSEPASDDHQYVYNVYPVNCTGSNITKYSSYGDISGSPSDLIQFYTGNGYRILRNPSGTHIVAVQNGTYPYQGVVAGVTIGSLPSGVYFTAPPEALNQFCTPVSSPIDQDGDGFPDCLDCNILDSEQNIECATCDDNCPYVNNGPPSCTTVK